jgi:serine/threonine-protein kinase
MQTCEALTVAHSAGVVHRDIKPDNLFLARHGQFETLKVLDFGISDDGSGASERGSGASERGSAASSRGHALGTPLYGTPAYMSPERIRNEPTADHRADIWSLGVVLHELITGRLLFDAPTPIEICARVLSPAPIPIEADDAVLPPSVRHIIARCLERDPSRRYQSVEELAAAAAPLASMTERFRGRSTGAFSRKFIEEQLALAKPLPQRGQAPETASAPLPPRSRPRWRVLGQSVAALVVSVLVVVLVASLGADESTHSSAPASERVATSRRPLQSSGPLADDAAARAPRESSAPSVQPQNVRAIYSPPRADAPGSSARLPSREGRSPLLDALPATAASAPAPLSKPSRESAPAPRAVRGVTSRAERARWRRQRAAAKLALRPKKAPLEPSAIDELSVSRRPARIELVPEQRIEHPTQPPDGSAPPRRRDCWYDVVAAVHLIEAPSCPRFGCVLRLVSTGIRPSPGCSVRLLLRRTLSLPHRPPQRPERRDVTRRYRTAAGGREWLAVQYEFTRR